MLLVLERPRIGDLGSGGPWGGRQDLGQDRHHLVNASDVGGSAVIGVGQRVSEVLAVAAGYPDMLSTRLAS